MVGIEGLGDAVTGGMLARAVEPEHGEATGHDEPNCLNCGAELQGAYCHQCGQKGHVHRTLHAFGHDLLHGVFHFEGKVWHTLPMLAWRPGELTRRYIDGERARFVSPIALFLFSVFLMFAVFGTVGGPFGFRANPQTNAEALRDVERETADLQRRATTVEQQRRQLAARGQPTAQADAELTHIRAELRAIEIGRNLVGAPAGDAAENKQVVLAPYQAPAGEPKTIDLSGMTIDTGWPWLDHALEKARDNPSLLAYKLQSNAYKFSWALIPISVPFLWLLLLHRGHYRRQYKAYDHTVFVTYSIAFMTLLMVALSLVRPIVGDGLAPFALTLVPPVHIYRQLRGAYGLGRFSSAWRTAALLVFALFSALLFFVLLLALGVLG
jgi:hypothetical protein